jgi:nitrite reductase/ring-hydroxylating ferredoxin subunit
MNRYEFLKSMGFGGAALMAVLTSCVSQEDTYIPVATIDPKATTASTGNPANPNIGATPITDISKITNPLVKIDISANSNSALKKVSGYVIQSGIVVAQVAAGSYAAVTNTCSHEPKKQVIFDSGEFYCTAHGARFDITGKGLNSVGSRGVKAYNVATDGKTVVVY